MALSQNLVGVILAATLLLSQVFAMKPEEERTEQKQETLLMELPAEIVMEVFDRLPDAESIVHFAWTCKTAHSVVEWKLLGPRLFWPKTPINKVPLLIRDFSKSMKASPDLQQFAASLEPVQVVRLLDRLLDATHYSGLSRDDKGLFTMTRFSNPSGIFEEDEVVEMVISLIKAVNRPEITRITSIFLSPYRCLPQIVSHLDPIPMPTNIPEPIMDFIKRKQANDLSRYTKDARDLIVSVRKLFPTGFRMFPDNDFIAYQLSKDPALIEALSVDPVPILLDLLSVGIRFRTTSFKDVPLKADSLPAIFPLLFDKVHAFELMGFWYFVAGKKEHALSLLRTSDFRALIACYPKKFANQVGEMIRRRDIDVIQILVREHFLTEIVNVSIDDGGLLLLVALETEQRVEIAKLLMTVPNIDLYQLPVVSSDLCKLYQARGLPVPQLPPPIQSLFDGGVPKKERGQILKSDEFQNLIRCNRAAFRDFLRKDERRLKLLRSLCRDFASEIMKDETLSEQEIQCVQIHDLPQAGTPSSPDTA